MGTVLLIHHGLSSWRFVFSVRVLLLGRVCDFRAEQLTLRCEFGIKTVTALSKIQLQFKIGLSAKCCLNKADIPGGLS